MHPTNARPTTDHIATYTNTAKSGKPEQKPGYSEPSQRHPGLARILLRMAPEGGRPQDPLQVAKGSCFLLRKGSGFPGKAAAGLMLNQHCSCSSFLSRSEPMTTSLQFPSLVSGTQPDSLEQQIPLLCDAELPLPSGARRSAIFHSQLHRAILFAHSVLSRIVHKGFEWRPGDRVSPIGSQAELTDGLLRFELLTRLTIEPCQLDPAAGPGPFFPGACP